MFQRNTYLLFILFFTFFMGRRSVNTEKIYDFSGLRVKKWYKTLQM